jgi:predicted signal transduction protein with EAL and GGDEF domain|tara:strand:- start:209 stop:577 length:369 start_codon:yes stop_codon:yes gene_type:complete
MATRRKVTIPVINGIERMFKAGTKQKYIALAYNISVATVQNVKKTGFNYDNYNNLVNSQLSKWKLNKSNNTVKATKDNKTFVDVQSITQDAKTDFIIEKIARLESNTNWLVDRIMRIFPEDK